MNFRVLFNINPEKEHRNGVKKKKLNAFDPTVKRLWDKIDNTKIYEIADSESEE